MTGKNETKIIQRMRGTDVLADNIAKMLASYPGDDMILTAESASEVLAALRAVEAMRAWRQRVEAEADQNGSGQ